jgi:hypothetical protein
VPTTFSLSRPPKIMLISRPTTGAKTSQGMRKMKPVFSMN